ncbi:hypothetical protein [Microvirga tunisiensis]|uniref:Uncharacterized protein n=1 Tax=Microvirga tunisiensis TaxID=2108360 RepID=A0A5N7MVD6_9HYPH|nr:hypothetical protein [Microvirga tunisiensis]MPR13052.1 hypothetical protein [Microvirga tunisiensis]MPR30945.1 hypothetical protein [Microvirga tunisiensis]
MQAEGPDAVRAALEALVRALAPNAAGGLGRGPTGEPTPGQPVLPEPFPVEIPPLVTWARLAIQGLEFTQAIQHYGTGYDADNAVPLVALKPMVVRAYPYVARGLFGDDGLSGRHVTGELILSRTNGDVAYRTGPTRPSGTRVGPERRLDRTLWDQEITFYGGLGELNAEPVFWNAPLNFHVPGWYLRRGHMVVTVRIWLVDAPHLAKVASERIHLLDVRPPRISLVRIKMTDDAGTVYAPTDAKMLETTRLAERMLPFPYLETLILGWELSLKGIVEGSEVCPLLPHLYWIRVFNELFGLGQVVFGIVGGSLSPNAHAGCRLQGQSIAACVVGLQGSFTHELGHLYGRDLHVGSAPKEPEDPNYPNYGGDRRSIGEVGIDAGLAPLELKDPAEWDDIMSNGQLRWISPYTYRAILNARGMFDTVPADPRRVKSWLVLKWRLVRQVEGEWRLEVDGAHRIAAPGRLRPRPYQEGIAPATPVALDFVDCAGRILATHHAFAMPAPEERLGDGCCGCGRYEPHIPESARPWLDFFEPIPWPEGDVARILLVREGRLLDSLEVGEPPSLELGRPQPDGERVAIPVLAAHPRVRPSVLVLFTGDDGESWHPVAVDPEEGEVALEARYLAGGERCRFRAVATAELQACEAESETFALPRRRRALFVQARQVRPPDAVRFSATIDSGGLGGVPPEEVLWHSDLDGELGRGTELQRALSPGRHEITVRAPDGLGGTLSERAIIVVGG